MMMTMMMKRWWKGPNDDDNDVDKDNDDGRHDEHDDDDADDAADDIANRKNAIVLVMSYKRVFAEIVHCNEAPGAPVP